jgi:hypothetical protein
MGSIVFWVGALIAVSVLSPVLKVLIAAVAGKQIGAAALAKQPDQIHLERVGPSAWKKGAARRIVDELTSRGFVDAGIHTVTELPGIVLQLLAHPRDNFYAAVYEHPQAGTWFDLVARFQDGTSVTYSTARPTGLRPRPGHPTINVPGLDPIPVLDKAIAQRPRKPLVTVTADQAARVFEQSYAESMAFRKQQGISTQEVVNTATRKVA